MAPRPAPAATTIVTRARALPRPRPILDQLTPRRLCETIMDRARRAPGWLQRLQPVTLFVTAFSERHQGLSAKGYRLQKSAGPAHARARAREDACCNL